MSFEPARRVRDNGIQRARLLEQMSRAWNEDQLFGRGDFGQRLLIELAPPCRDYRRSTTWVPAHFALSPGIGGIKGIDDLLVANPAILLVGGSCNVRDVLGLVDVSVIIRVHRCEACR